VPITEVRWRSRYEGKENNDGDTQTRRAALQTWDQDQLRLKYLYEKVRYGRFGGFRSHGIVTHMRI
jgi:hypothetical protein